MFKTKDQMLKHHNKHDEECTQEKLKLIKLIVKMKTFLKSFINKYKIDKVSIVNSATYKKLQVAMKEFEDENLINSTLFYSNIGHDCLDLFNNK